MTILSLAAGRNAKPPEILNHRSHGESSSYLYAVNMQGVHRRAEVWADSAEDAERRVLAIRDALKGVRG